MKQNPKTWRMFALALFVLIAIANSGCDQQEKRFALVQLNAHQIERYEARGSGSVFLLFGGASYSERTFTEFSYWAYAVDGKGATYWVRMPPGRTRIFEDAPPGTAWAVGGMPYAGEGHWLGVGWQVHVPVGSIAKTANLNFPFGVTK